MMKRAVVVPILVLGMAVALFFGIRSHWIMGESETGDQRTDDAYVKADQTPLSTRISGTVKRVAVGDYQSVTAGQILVELEDADYQAMLKESEAALEGAKQNIPRTRMPSMPRTQISKPHGQVLTRPRLQRMQHEQVSTQRRRARLKRSPNLTANRRS